jgi:FlaA1/EpsC-like NDP-sugar epimerase
LSLPATIDIVEKEEIMQNTVIIAGAGTFGTALAERLCWNVSNTVILYDRDKSVVDEINKEHRNSAYFPTHILSTSIRATGDLHIFRLRRPDSPGHSVQGDRPVRQGDQRDRQ